jgi:hypothetical protein
MKTVPLSGCFSSGETIFFSLGCCFEFLSQVCWSFHIFFEINWSTSKC